MDVLVDMKMQGANDSFSKTILQNITVMTIGQTWEQKENKPVVVNTVTLEVTPEQAEILNLASTEGKIRLALRSRRNENIVETSGVAMSQLLAGVVKKEKQAITPNVQPSERRTDRGGYQRIRAHQDQSLMVTCANQGSIGSDVAFACQTLKYRRKKIGASRLFLGRTATGI